MFEIDSTKLIRVGTTKPDPAWKISVHSHDFWEFLYFLHGAGRIDTPESTIRPRQYNVIAYPPGLPHSEISDPYNPEETIYLNVDVQRIAPQSSHLLIVDQSGEMCWLCRHLLKEVSASGITRLALSYCRSFLCLVDDALETAHSVKQDAVDLAVQYIHANYNRNISLDELAHASFVSKSHLSHCFATRLGTSPLQYLRLFRVEAAKRLLMNTDLHIYEIALQIGLADPQYFSRMLKRLTGCSPSEFREQFRHEGHS